VPGAGELPAGPELREFARQTLPETMVPSAFVALDELPLNANGKLDRAALPDPPATVTTAAPLSETERRLADIWVDLLALDTPIGPSDDFFELGGESLVAFEMFELIHEQFGCDLPENVIVEASTLRALAERIDAGTVGDRRLVRINPGAQRVPCMYVHAGAGGMFTLRRFSSRLGEDQPVFGVQAFRDAQIELGDLVSVEATAAECLDVLREVQPKGPYMLAGHSIGGHIAFDMACTLQAAGEEILFLGLMDPAAPHTQRQVGRFKARARELTGTGPEPRRKGLARSALAAARARVGPRDGDSGDTPTAAAAVDTNVQAWMDNLAHVERDYDPPDFRGDAVVYTTAEMARWTGSPTLGWERHVDGELARRRVPGDHLSMLLDPHARELARAMAADLRAAQATVGA
jgi:thioesterase domain-containing protein/acyl carrier protein